MARRRPSRLRWLGRRSPYAIGGVRARVAEWASIAPHGDVHRRLPRLQGLADRRAGDSRAPHRRRPPRGRERGRGGSRRQHVLRDQRGGAEVPAGGTEGCANGEAGLRDRLRGEPRRRRLRVAASQRHGRPAFRRTDAFVHRRRRRGDRLPRRQRRARQDARVHQGAGRLQLLVRVLRHSAGPRCLPEPRGGGRPRRDPQAGRAGAPRGRPHGDQPGLLPGPRGADGPAGAGAGRRQDRRPRPSSPLVDRGQPREPRAAGGDAGDGRGLAAPPRPAAVGGRRHPHRDAPPVLGGDLPAAGRAGGGVQPDDRRDRRVPGRGRRGVRAHAASGRGGGHHEGACVSVLAAPRYADGRGRPRAARGEEGTRRASIARAEATATITLPGSCRHRSALSSGRGRWV
jgi:hypothetical protein